MKILTNGKSVVENWGRCCGYFQQCGPDTLEISFKDKFEGIWAGELENPWNVVR